MTLEKVRDRICQLAKNDKTLLEPYLDPEEPNEHLSDTVMAVDTVIRLLDQLVTAGYSTKDEVVNSLNQNTVTIDTPLGKLKAEPQNASSDRPGLWTSLVGPNGKDTNLASVEYDSNSQAISMRIYANPETNKTTGFVCFEWTKRLQSITSREEFRRWVNDNYWMPKDSLAQEIFDGVLDVADKMSTEEKREFFAKVIPSIPSYIIDRINY